MGGTLQAGGDAPVELLSPPVLFLRTEEASEFNVGAAPAPAVGGEGMGAAVERRCSDLWAGTAAGADFRPPDFVLPPS